MPLETHYRPLEGEGYPGPSSLAPHQGPVSHTTYQGPSSNTFPKRPAHVIHVPDHNPGEAGAGTAERVSGQPAQRRRIMCVLCAFIEHVYLYVSAVLHFFSVSLFVDVINSGRFGRRTAVHF